MKIPPASSNTTSSNPIPTFTLENAARYFDNKPHQVESLRFAQKVLEILVELEVELATLRQDSPNCLSKIASLYRDEKDNEVQSKLMTFARTSGAIDPPPSPPPDRGRIITIPGVGSVGVRESIIANGNFTWGEATKNGNRIPSNSTIANAIIAMAKEMELVRSYFGNRPITITSWYRDPTTNRQVGGASRSRHLQGDAVDFNVAGLSPQQVQAKLDSFWGSKGGLGYGKTFTHLDLRGSRSRWHYG